MLRGVFEMRQKKDNGLNNGSRYAKRADVISIPGKDHNESILPQIYLDNGATTQVDPAVVEAMELYFTEKYGNASSLHSFGADAKKAIEESRKVIANELHARPEEIIFTSGGTESDNLAIKGIAYLKGKGHIITSKIEHPAVLNTCKELEREGFKATYLDVDDHGIVDIKQLEQSIRPDTILITIMHANNEVGTIEPLDAICAIAKKYNVLVHTDAVQSFTKVLIDVSKTPVDIISMSAHKIHGPKGIGALYIKSGVRLHPLLHGGAHESKLRAGTENVPGIIGFAKAVQLDQKLEYVQALRDKLVAGLLEIPNTRLNGHPEKRAVNNASVTFDYVEGESMLFHLDMKGIAVSTGSACSSHSLEPSHVLLAMGMKHEQAHGTIRFTLSKFNTEKEIEYVIASVKEAVYKLRLISPIKGDENEL